MPTIQDDHKPDAATGGLDTQDAPQGLELIKTTCAGLQAKLDALVGFIEAGNKDAFVRGFVPLDLSEEDTVAYLGDLTTGEECETHWPNLAAEICAISMGLGVHRIEGDQITRAEFFFTHPLLQECDREVVFTCEGDEWRAEG